MSEHRIALADEIERLCEDLQGHDTAAADRYRQELARLIVKHEAVVLAALRQDAGAAMRERAAQLADAQAAQDRAAEAAYLPPDPTSPDGDVSLTFAGYAAAMEILAQDIRSLPLSDPKTASEGRDRT